METRIGKRKDGNEDGKKVRKDEQMNDKEGRTEGMKKGR